MIFIENSTAPRGVTPLVHIRDENSAPFSHRRSGGLRRGFAFLELLCTRIRDGENSPWCAADLGTIRLTEKFLTKIDKIAPGSRIVAHRRAAAEVLLTKCSS